MRISTIPPATLVVVTWLAGCSGPAPQVSPRPHHAAPAIAVATTDAILGGALGILERLDEYAEDEASRQVADRLAEWRRQQPGPTDAGPDPRIATLPERLRPVTAARDARNDVRGLRDLGWLAGIARQARERLAGRDQLAVAAELFRWTVRSLAIVTDPPAVPTAATPGSRWMLPGEILLAGRASAPQRAWIFLELLRQSGIDGVMLATGVDGERRAWLPAAVIEGEAYLFEPAYGMPVPGPGGVGIATARQAAADASILQSLSLPDHPYPLQAGDVQRLVPLVAADPWSLGGRPAAMTAALERLRGPRAAVDASALLDRARLAVPGSDQDRVGLWEFPFETLARRRADPDRVGAAVQADLGPLIIATLPSVLKSYGGQRPDAGVGRDGEHFDVQDRQDGPRFLRPLFAGRVREFRGDVTGAREAYMAARPSAGEIAAAVASAPAETRDGLKRAIDRMREDAGYWLGIMSLAAGEDRPAVDFLERVTLGEHPEGRWTDAARVNLADALIGLGQIKEAAVLLRADQSPQRYGSRLRAHAERP